MVWPFHRGQVVPDNEQVVSQPVYGADPLGAGVNHALDAAHLSTYGATTGNPIPAWKPQGDRERKSSWLYPPYPGTALQGLPQVQNFEGAAMVSKVVWRRQHLQQLGVAQPIVSPEIEALQGATLGLRLGLPGGMNGLQTRAG
jgi:hypothetical protein